MLTPGEHVSVNEFNKQAEALGISKRTLKACSRQARCEGTKGRLCWRLGSVPAAGRKMRLQALIEFYPPRVPNLDVALLGAPTARNPPKSAILAKRAK